eukprot:1189916-Prorocentrum_minimum.AAC.2
MASFTCTDSSIRSATAFFTRYQMAALLQTECRSLQTVVVSLKCDDDLSDRASRVSTDGDLGQDLIQWQPCCKLSQFANCRSFL